MLSIEVPTTIGKDPRLGQSVKSFSLIFPSI